MPPKRPSRPQQQAPEEAAVSRGLVALLAAEGDNPAAAKGPAKFRMTLYTGETVYRWGYSGQEAIILDVAGFKPRRDTGWPAMVDHWQRAGTIDDLTVDSAQATIAGTGRFLANDAELFPAAARAQAILSQGHALQCSGYWVPAKIEKVEAGAKASVNGKTVTGPIQIWREFSMREGSFTDLGRDEMTHAELAASMAGRPPLSAQEETQETKPMSATNLTLLSSLKSFVGADRAIELLTKQPDATDLAAFLPVIETEFTGIRAKLEQSEKDLAAAQGQIATLTTDLAAAKKAPVVAFAGGDGNQPRPAAAPGAGKTDEQLKADFAASAELQATYGSAEVYLTAAHKNLTPPAAK